MKHLQANVCKNVGGSVRERTISGIKEKTTSQRTTHNQLANESKSYNSSVQIHVDNNESSKYYDITKFKTKHASIEFKEFVSSPSTKIVPKFKLQPTTEIPSESLCTESHSRRGFENIETILAKITSSQRQICLVIDSLM